MGVSPPCTPAERNGLSSPPKRSIPDPSTLGGRYRSISEPSTRGHPSGHSWLRSPTTEKEPRHPWAGRGRRGHSQDLRVSIGNSNPSHGARVAAQEEEGDVASCGHQVDEHGHPNGPEGRKTELLHQETTQEDPQAGTGDRSHPWERNRGVGTVSRGRRARPNKPLGARCGTGRGR